MRDNLCQRTTARHRSKNGNTALHEYCDDLIDEHSKAIADLVIADTPWPEVKSQICVQVAGHCEDDHGGEL
ncbi:hypothetical protein CYMTET_18902 [Cymbomonas tetramitiformis]|uniref:DUF3456 domain-containing protein n=1 Tax=Cymbomonas tetramitiformis TaxID=36881 RepID=A0AAE0L5Q4_9CHLO|nr:hypothetical protein CYMTET_18902 [Cymbomonas tetramitiformis]